MPIITIISDWQQYDHYAAALKGVLLAGSPAARVIELSHQVACFDTAQAAFLVRHSYRYFPKETIHLIAVDKGARQQHFLAVKAYGHYFLSNDSGIFGLLFDHSPEHIVELPVDENNTRKSFMAHSVLAPAAVKLAQGEDIRNLGQQKEDYFRHTPLMPSLEEHSIAGRIIYIDSYHNAITNISQDFFEQVRQKRPFIIYVQSFSNKIQKISKAYHQVLPGELLALFNSADLLEIAINQGYAAELLNLTTDSTVRVKFSK